MQKENKYQKISKIAAKTATRLFLIIMVMGLLPFITGDQPWSAKLANAHFIIPNKWTLIAPAMLFIGMVTLLILAVKNKYQQTDFNWLLVLNTVVLLSYLILIYIRLYKLIFI